jgi:lipopolysaccharide export LptBFGC system permease protein LptF
MGATEKINYIAAVWMPLLFLLFAILILVRKINEK